MVQISKNILYSNAENDIFDSYIEEVFHSKSIIDLAELKNLSDFFFKHIVPKIDSLTKKSINDLKAYLPLKQSDRSSFMWHLISGGGGSIFKYRNLIFKFTPKNKEIVSEKDIEEVTVPKYIKKLLELNCYNTISDFITIPLYIRYGEFSIEFNALHNLHQLCLMIISYTKMKHEKKHISKLTLLQETTQLTHEDKNNLGKITQINLMLLSHYLDIKIELISNISSFNVIPKSAKTYGYITTSPIAIMSANKMSVHTLSDYFNDKKLNYHSMLESLSLQMIFQILLFYHTILKMKPAFVHRDLKLDNILVKELPSHEIKQNITIDDEAYKVNIETPLIFLINDFEKSEIESSKSWFHDLTLLFFSIKHYKNLLLPARLYPMFEDKNKIMSYDDLSKLLKDKLFSKFIKKM